MTEDNLMQLASPLRITYFKVHDEKRSLSAITSRVLFKTIEVQRGGVEKKMTSIHIGIGTNSPVLYADEVMSDEVKK